MGNRGRARYGIRDRDESGRGSPCGVNLGVKTIAGAMEAKRADLRVQRNLTRFARVYRG